MPNDNRVRLSRNVASKQYAENDREPWGASEDEFLLEQFPDCKGNPDEEMALAELMGRTIEACRQRFYEIRAGRKRKAQREAKHERKDTTTAEYRGLHDEEEERWWDPSYYQR